VTSSVDLPHTILPSRPLAWEPRLTALPDGRSGPDVQGAGGPCQKAGTPGASLSL
jgi:hypothetical protein